MGKRDTTIPDAAAAAKALGPLAGHAAETVFALGLLGAAFLGLSVVPLTSAYATTEALGLERGLDLRPRQAPAFYGLLGFFLGAAAVFVLIPGLPLIRVMFLAQVVNGLLLPVILVFVMLLSHRRDLLDELVSGRLVLGLRLARHRPGEPDVGRARRHLPAAVSAAPARSSISRSSSAAACATAPAAARQSRRPARPARRGRLSAGQRDVARVAGRQVFVPAERIGELATGGSR